MYRSLFQHLQDVKDIDSKAEAPAIRRLLYNLTTAFTPELSVDEVMAKMVITVKTAIDADRVGFFVLTEDKKSMVLKVSERSKGNA